MKQTVHCHSLAVEGGDGGGHDGDVGDDDEVPGEGVKMAPGGYVGGNVDEKERVDAPAAASYSLLAHVLTRVHDPCHSVRAYLVLVPVRGPSCFPSPDHGHLPTLHASLSIHTQKPASHQSDGYSASYHRPPMLPAFLQDRT